MTRRSTKRTLWLRESCCLPDYAGNKWEGRVLVGPPWVAAFPWVGIMVQFVSVVFLWEGLEMGVGRRRK